MNTVDAKENQTNRSDFKLIRHFALTAVISIACVSALLGNMHQQSANKQLLEYSKKHHQEISRLYTNLVWTNYGEYLLKLDTVTIELMSDSLRYQKMHDEVIQEISESQVLKLKIFNKQGLTVYSSDRSQTGQLKTGYPGFEAAMAGEVTSEFTFRESFNKGLNDGLLFDRYVYSSYVPVYEEIGSDKIVAVIELYSDVTQLVNEVSESRNKFLSITIVVMLLLFSVLLVNVVRAQKIIREHQKIQENMKEQAYWQANHDVLTSLPNRKHFNKLLADRMTSQEGSDRIQALFFIDLDFFKPINDRFGHQAGDMVLKEVAQRISDVLPTGAVVARIGGDEFTAFFEITKTTRDVKKHSDALIESLLMPFKFNDIECSLSASIGITYCENLSNGTDALLAEADRAMYESKRKGRGRANTFSNIPQKRVA